jgi:pimeloyl-ACP methyl ester carboxylesterase
MVTARVARQAPEQTRARQPDASGYVDRDHVRIFFEAYGTDGPAVLLMPTWSIVHSRIWKAQIPYLARRNRVITFDPRGNGRSDRPTDPEAYDEREFAEDAVAVLDATQSGPAVVVGLSLGAQRSLILAADHPDRVAGLVMIAPSVALGSGPPDRTTDFEAVPATAQDLAAMEGWSTYNAAYWRHDLAGFLAFFFGRCFTERHSTKQIEDAIGWGLETDADSLVANQHADGPDAGATRELCARIRCPTLVIQGSDDAVTGPDRGVALAEALGAPIAWLEGGGHLVNARHPVRTNLILRDFVDDVSGTRPPIGTWTRALRRRRRALYISSPIGLGHAQRDVAIAAELRLRNPDLEIDWLAQHPVTAVLEAHGERVHPASALLASESAHVASEATEHELNAFQAIRRMDEILVSNFMVFHDVVASGEYDLVVGDEAWDVDYFLHENPELKRTAYAWLTDFVGWLPMPDGGPREAALTADYNAEMIEQIARFPRVRDRAIFVGSRDDVVPDAFGPGLPAIGDWTARHYDFAGYVTGFDSAPLVARREELREELGYRPGERIVVVTVGGSGVGEALLRRVVASYPEASRRVDGLRMIAVAGPRIAPDSLQAPSGVEVRAYVPDLYRHLAACDLAVVQGGLTTTMELVASRRPFLYFPLARHFEQCRHVVHRLERYGAGRRLDFATSDPDAIAAAIAEEIGRDVDYRPVETDGAARAAALIGELI